MTLPSPPLPVGGSAAPASPVGSATGFRPPTRPGAPTVPMGAPPPCRPGRPDPFGPSAPLAPRASALAYGRPLPAPTVPHHLYAVNRVRASKAQIGLHNRSRAFGRQHRREPCSTVEVVCVPLTRDGVMPFADGEFDRGLNRHSGLNCAEVARVLAPEGVFLTQQIHGLWAQDLLAAFGAVPQWPDATPEYYVPSLKAAGLRVERLQEWQGRLIFHDVGAMVYYLTAVPWLVPGFSVETHTGSLMKLQEQLQREGQLVFEARKYLIEAAKVI